MRQAMSPKESHKRLGPRSEPFVKRLQRGFARKNIADQDSDKIDQIIRAEACPSETHLFLNGFQKTSMREHLSKDRHFPQKGRG